VGVAEYQLTANVWIRGILAEHHGLPVRDVTYVTGGLEDPRRIEKIQLDLPPEIRVERAPDGTTLSQLLADGDLAAIYSPRAPAGAVRLFEDFPAVERAYYETARIFPIMHVLAIRTELYEANRWMARSLFKAFSAARDEAIAALGEVAALKVSLPWARAHFDDAQELMGTDYWSYGVDPNRQVLEKFLDYARDQGLAGDQDVDSLFAPETLEAFAI
jgi:4,5-dihydroxyphthalate decarboxylase